MIAPCCIFQVRYSFNCQRSRSIRYEFFEEIVDRNGKNKISRNKRKNERAQIIARRCSTRQTSWHLREIDQDRQLQGSSIVRFKFHSFYSQNNRVRGRGSTKRQFRRLCPLQGRFSRCKDERSELQGSQVPEGAFQRGILHSDTGRSDWGAKEGHHHFLW